MIIVQLFRIGPQPGPATHRLPRFTLPSQELLRHA